METSSHHQPARMDAKCIKRLMRAVMALKNADCPIDVDRMWSKSFPVLRHGDAKTSQDIMDLQVLPRTTLKPALKELKHLLSTLRCLASSLEKKISSVEANYMSMVLFHGMKTAPVEVLDNIFEMACFEDNHAAFNLSLVNKRFHDIAMRNPRLWNKIGNCNLDKASLGQLQICLKRSKDVGLDVKLDFGDEDVYANGVEILGVAVPEASRWESVSYLMESLYDEYWSDLFWDISRYSTGLNFPRLQSATLRYPKLRALNEDDPESIIDQSEPLMHFYTTWYLPNLTNLTVYNLIPRPSLHHAPPLTTLTLDINESDGDDAMLERVYDMDLLLELLRSSPLLETFHLRLECFTPSTKDDDHTLPETVLPNLQTFDFTAFNLTAQSILPFMKALRFPSLRNLRVFVDADKHIIKFGGNVWLDCVLPHSYEHYMNVEVFRYETRASNEIADLDDYFPYDVPFEKLHNLRSIILGTPYLKPNLWRSRYDARACMRLPKLEDIHFASCDGLDGVELSFFKELLEKQGKWDMLKKVTFEWCGSLSESIVRRLFEGKDVTWEYEE